MAQHLEAKGANETVERRWTLAGVTSVSVSASGITASAAIEGDEVVFTLSGGTAGTTGAVTATLGNNDSETLVEVFYVPIVAPQSTGMTARDVCEYALRKVYGKDETPEASAMSDAVERLEDMLRMWAATGADVGATFPIVEATVINCRPSFQRAIKENLVIEVADLYNRVLSPVTVDAARRGLQHIKSANLPAERTAAEYF